MLLVMKMRKIELGLLVVCFAIATLLLSAQPATAISWELAAETDQGLVRQYFDRDSIQWSGTKVTVTSYYIDERSIPQRVDYITAYECASNQFKDVKVDGQRVDNGWQPLVNDPLNEEIRNLLCSVS